MALVALSVVEQRLDAVRAVLSGATVTEVAAAIGVSRQSVHTWIARYLAEGLPGLADRSHRPGSCPHQVAGEVEVVVAEMRRQHPRWGAKRIRLELLRRPPAVPVPSERTINRVLARQGLLVPRPRKRPRESYKRWQRPAPMQLWQIDIVGGVMICDTATGELREAKIMTGVDDHSRYCVICQVVERATGRAVCLALAAALARFGVPEEILTDIQRQAFTDRFGKGGEVLFDKICRKNGVTHRLTAPASPTTTGKIERFHLTLRRELLDEHRYFTSIQAAQAAFDAWVAEYNADRPHQALDGKAPVTPDDRFTPQPAAQRGLIDLWLPPALAPATQDTLASLDATAVPARWQGGPVEFDRVVPPSGNLWVAHRQFWLGPARAGTVIRFWADCQLIHLSAGGARIKTLRSQPPHPAITVELLAEAIRQVAGNVWFATVAHPLKPTAWDIRWGAQIDPRIVRLTGDGQITDTAVAAYLAKYATKSTEAAGLPPGKITRQNAHLYASQRSHQGRLIDACLKAGNHSRGQLHHRETKTAGSEATLPLPDICLTALKLRAEEQTRDRAAAADAWEDLGLVFSTRFGMPYEPRNFARHFTLRCAKAGVRVIKVHDTRRTCGSLLAALDVHPRIAMQILRHSKIAITMEIYTEIPDEGTREALRRMGSQLGS